MNNKVPSRDAVRIAVTELWWWIGVLVCSSEPAPEVRERQICGSGFLGAARTSFVPFSMM